MMRAYQPVLNMSEHLLAKLKTAGPQNGNGNGGGGGGGVNIKSEYLLDSQSRRYAAEVFPAIKDLVAKHHFAHLLDLSCGSGELLIHLASKLKKVVAIGIGADTPLVRRANSAITAADLEKRLIAVPANPLDVCRDTQKTFDRIGISRQLWQELDLVIATSIFTDLTREEGLPTIAKSLAGLRKNFPKASLLIIEPVSSPRFEKNYYAPELALLLRLTRSIPWPPGRWHDLFSAAGYKLAEETGLITDGLSLFLLKPS